MKSNYLPMIYHLLYVLIIFIPSCVNTHIFPLCYLLHKLLSKYYKSLYISKYYYDWMRTMPVFVWKLTKLIKHVV